MKYFKNTELAKLYNVSEKSVRNWIQAAKEGKLELTLHTENGKATIANTTRNTTLIEELVQKGKKYKNTRGYKVIRPSEKFYKLYTPQQIVDIISNIDIYREIPLQYTYFNSGAERWDKYTQHLLRQQTPNSLKNTINLIDLGLGYLDVLIGDYDQVNVIDVGVGNALPVRGLLQHLIDNKKLGRYIGIDISQEMLDIAGKNVKEWFKGTVQFEGYVKDISHDRFNDLLTAEAFSTSKNRTINLVLFLGGTISNFREPNHVLTSLRDSMGKHDLLLFSKKLDTEKSRRYFEMAATGNQALDLVLSLLNIDRSLYTTEQYFDENKMARQLVARLNVALTVKFELYGTERAIDLNKGDGILLWRARHQSGLDTLAEFDENGFELLHASRSKDRDYLLLVSRIKLAE